MAYQPPKQPQYKAYQPYQPQQQSQQQPPRRDHRESYPPPLFVAELDGGSHQPPQDHGQEQSMPMSPDGNPIFEMAAEPPPVKTDVTGGGRRPERREMDAHGSAANPWPYHGPGGRDGDESTPSATVHPPIASQNFASGPHQPQAHSLGQPQADGRPAYPSPGISPSYTADSLVSGSEAQQLDQHDSRPSTVSPVNSPSSSHQSYFPAPLNIGRPPRSVSPKYKPYSPPLMDERQSSGQTSQGKSQAAAAMYKPYRRPSFKEEVKPEPEPEARIESPRPGPSKGAAVDGGSGAGTPPYPPAFSSGAAPHHFHMPEAPTIPDDTRPNKISSPSSGTDSPRPQATSPPTSKRPEETVLWPPPAGTRPPGANPPPPSQQEEIVLWPHPAAMSPRPDAPAQHPPMTILGPRPDAPLQQGPEPVLSTRPDAPPAQIASPPPSTSPYQAISPNVTGVSAVSANHTGTLSPNHTGVSSVSSIHSHSGRTPSASPVASTPLPPQDTRPPVENSRPSKMGALPQDPIPHSPPPAYDDIAPGPSSQPPQEKPSLFPQAPSTSAPHSPSPQGYPQQHSSSPQYPIQQQQRPPRQSPQPSQSSVYPAQQQHCAPQPSPQSAHYPAQQQQYPLQHSPQSSQYPAQQQQHPPSPGYGPPPGHLPHVGRPYGPQAPPVAQPTYSSPPPQGHPQGPPQGYQQAPSQGHQQGPYPGQQYSSLQPPPPLPPRPSSSHNQAPPPTGFGSAPPPNPAAYPPPPKTNYVPQNPPGAYQKPYGSSNYAGGSAKIFNHAAANKWMRKGGQFVESKIGQVLHNHPDPRYHPAPGSYGYQSQPQQGQQYPAQQGHYSGQQQQAHQGYYGGQPASQGQHPQHPQYAQQPGQYGPRPEGRLI